MRTKLSFTLHLANLTILYLANLPILIPAYNQKLKQEVPETRSIRKWSDDADPKLQDCFASQEWNMFRD